MSVHPSICLSTGGVPISHNALQHFPECHEAVVGGYPAPPGGTWVRYPPGGYPGQVPPWGGTRVRYPPGGVPGSGTPPGGSRVRYPPGGVPGSGTPWGYPGQVPPRGGTQVGQQKEYSLHGGRYASCVHAGGLSCCADFCQILIILCLKCMLN